MRVLVGCEYSGRVRDAFIAMGHDAMSCDLLPTESPGPHYQGDVRDLLTPSNSFDLFIVHPDCTYLTSSAAWAYKDGPYHQTVKPETLVGGPRREAREKALEFFAEMLDAPVGMIAVENPVGVVSTRIRPADQYIHPNEYGDNASKKTGLWLKNLPLLAPTEVISPRIVEWPRGSGKMVNRWGNQTDSGQNKLPPSADRWKVRSATYQGIATAMSEQWGGFL
jgi:hypothetical protein